MVGDRTGSMEAQSRGLSPQLTGFKNKIRGKGGEDAAGAVDGDRGKSSGPRTQRAVLLGAHSSGESGFQLSWEGASESGVTVHQGSTSSSVGDPGDHTRGCHLGTVCGTPAAWSQLPFMSTLPAIRLPQVQRPGPMLSSRAQGAAPLLGVHLIALLAGALTGSRQLCSPSSASISSPSLHFMFFFK
jgi:hypothetical protein